MMTTLPVRADDLRLIAILDGGQPAFCAGELSPQARDVLDGTAQLYAADGFVPPWIGYLAQAGGEIVGSCAFKAPPRDGEVEIAYHTFAEHEGRGIATAMAEKLIAVARQHAPALTVSARTVPKESAATRILRKLGFRLRDSLRDPHDGIVWHWQLDAPRR
jgi:ribosomal-protein-alanine N-acetyltransferase